MAAWDYVPSLPSQLRLNRTFFLPGILGILVCSRDAMLGDSDKSRHINYPSDVTGFAVSHPGGESIIREYFRRDASNPYNVIHRAGLIAKFLGEKKIRQLIKEDLPEKEDISTIGYEGLPPLDSIINLYDFQDVATQALTERALAYVSGASNDCLTITANANWFRRIFLCPRILRNVKHYNTSISIFGAKFNIPVFNTPASLVKLVHPDGEVAIARATAAMGTTIIIPTISSYSTEEIVNALPEGHPFFFQLYVNPNRSITRSLLKDIRQLKPRAIIVTADLPVFSKREANKRYEAKAANHARKGNNSSNRRKQARSAAQTIASNLKWKDLEWIKEVTGLPIVVKGIQCARDAKLALDHGCEGIYISNHGGRAADTASPSILTLLEIRKKNPEVLKAMQVFIDGGVRRSSDILKAIYLGARGVYLGRPFFHAAVYGQDGIEHALEIIRDKLRTAMQLVGITNLSEASPDLLNTKYLDRYAEDDGYLIYREVLQSKMQATRRNRQVTGVNCSHRTFHEYRFRGLNARSDGNPEVLSDLAGGEIIARQNPENGSIPGRLPNSFWSRRKLKKELWPLNGYQTLFHGPPPSRSPGSLLPTMYISIS
ncbi:FMN-dependent dehydrogenase-domain-containing protein [Fusarium tricinctum]|uniref:FMN-dependent dehydrogenase-domain-containing protein n=1 Tax=Fusarium tricinctum TaxID=61284 RepID=A0A8K0WC37_9HYPO|nr:FMN-dependent dehydrogenase-domain-containing protein [Fusarium tricinctum]